MKTVGLLGCFLVVHSAQTKRNIVRSSQYFCLLPFQKLCPGACPSSAARWQAIPIHYLVDQKAFAGKQQVNHLDLALLCCRDQRERPLFAPLLGHHKFTSMPNFSSWPTSLLAAIKRTVQLLTQPLQHLGSLKRLGLLLRLLLLDQQRLRLWSERCFWRQIMSQ